MTKEEYFEKAKDLMQKKVIVKFGSKLTEAQKETNKQITLQLRKLLSDYIESSKPCSIGDTVNMTLNKGRKVKEVVITNLGILNDGNIHPTSYTEKGKSKYITEPVMKIEILTKQ